MHDAVFEIGDIVEPVDLKLKGQFQVIAAVPPGTVRGQDGYNVILNHKGPYKIYPRDAAKWRKVV